MNLRPLNLLILEDNPDDAELAVAELERDEFSVTWMRVENEETFREALKKGPDLILADYKLPSFDGISAIKIKQKSTPEIPLIIISGTVGEETAVECIKKGATDYVLKDKLLRLVPVVKRALKEAEERFRLKEAEKEKRLLRERLSRAEKMESLGILAGGVAHDLNNILMGLVSYPDLLLMKLPEDNPLRKIASTIKKSGQRAADVVQDLLTLGRRGVSNFQVINLNDILTKCLEFPETKEFLSLYPHCRIETNLKKNLFNISGSPLHLSKTVINLIINGAESMPEGGKIVISTQNCYVDRPLSGYDKIEEGDYVVLKITDTGVGVSRQDLKRIFEPFYTKKVMGRTGTGLGMAVVWGTVQDHKGYIDIKSKIAAGTTFTLYFPVNRDAPRDKTETLPLTEEIKGNEKILIIRGAVQKFLKPATF